MSNRRFNTSIAPITIISHSVTIIQTLQWIELLTMAQQNEKYELIDKGKDGWEFNQNPQEWGPDVILSWLEHLDDDFYDDHEEVFSLKNISGENFKRTELGNALWCRNDLGIDPQTAESFSKIVRQRITNYENSQNESNEEIVMKIDKFIEEDDNNNGNHNDSNPISPIIQVPEPRIESIDNVLNSPIANHNGPGSPLNNHHQSNENKKNDDSNAITPGQTKIKIIEDNKNKVDFMKSIENLPSISKLNLNQQLQPNEINMQEAIDAVSSAMQYPNNQIRKPPPIRQLKQEIDWSKLGPPPDLPFAQHPPPSLKSMSNKFRQSFVIYVFSKTQ